MEIVIKSKKIKDNLVDEKGNVLGTISYNPEDTGAYTKLLEVVDMVSKITEVGEEIEKTNIEEIPENKELTIEELKKYSENLKELHSNFKDCDELIEKIKGNIDDIFGKGTANIVMENTNDLTLLTPFIEAVTPSFSQARNKKVSKYISSANSDVLE